MIHEAMILEYSARHLALIEWAAALKLFNYSCIGLALFFPCGIAAAGATGWRCSAPRPVLIAKLALGGFALALIETLSAKMRIFRAPEFLGTAFLLAVLGDARQPAARQLGLDAMTGLPLYAQLINLFAAILLLLAFAMLTQRRVLSLVNLFAAQGLALGVSTAIVAFAHRPAASLRIGGTHAGAQGRAAAVAAAPADPQARRASGTSRG